MWVMRAGPRELGAVSDLLAGAARWLHDGMGLDQWPDRFPTERLAEAIDQQSTYVVLDKGKAVGTVTLDESPDKEFWSHRECLQSSLYVSRLAIDRSYRGLGSRILDWAGTQAAERDDGWLRLDAWKTNAGLRNYYVGQEFEHVRTVDLPHRRSGALFQRPAYSKESSLFLVGEDQVRSEVNAAAALLPTSPLTLAPSVVVDDR